MKTCPYCMGQVNHGSKKCQHCGSDLSRAYKTLSRMQVAAAFALSVAAIALTVKIWDYQKNVDYSLNLTAFKAEAMRIRELERDFKYFEAYRSYRNLKELYPDLWASEKWIQQRQEALPINRGKHKIVIFGAISDRDGLAACIRKIKQFGQLKNLPGSIWIENSVTADDYCCIVSRFANRASAEEALPIFQASCGKQCYYVEDEPSDAYRLSL